MLWAGQSMLQAHSATITHQEKTWNLYAQLMHKSKALYHRAVNKVSTRRRYKIAQVKELTIYSMWW